MSREPNDQSRSDLESIFERALDLAGAERERFLDEACSGSEALRAEVDALLACDLSDDSLLDAAISFDPDTEPSARHGQHPEIIDRRNEP